MLESDRREIWRYGQLQRETQGIGLVLVKVREWGSSPQEMSYAPITRLSAWPEPLIGWVRGLTTGKGGGLCIDLNRGQDWRFLFMAPDLSTVDVIETFLQQVEERMNHEQRKTKSRKRAR
jgi:hypothetical protein